MGIAFKDLFESKEISIQDLKEKVLIIDSYNLLYQFLTTIRARDGSLLTDHNGKVTSHLVGLFSRISKFMGLGLKLAFVFDGTPPKLKKKERQRRKELKLEAQKKYEQALREQDITEMRKQASHSTRLTKEMVKESKKLISGFGLPIIDAPSEGEAQAAYMIKKGEGYAVVSQDFDSLVHGSPNLVRNLSISGKRKSVNKLKYESVKPELINLSENLNALGIDNNQLIALGMLIGTDYNPGGIKGIGPKNALKLVKKHGSDFSSLFSEVKWDSFFDIGWEEVYYLIKKLPVTDNYELKWNPVDLDFIKGFLINERGFSSERVEKSLKKLSRGLYEKKQTGLSDFF